jgi:hypothetical protein
MKPNHLFIAALAALLIPDAGRAAAERKPTLTLLEKDKAIFQERCRKAGEFIHRTAEDVEGIFLLKLRSGKINRDDQYRMDDPYGLDLGGEWYSGHDRDEEAYIRSFLRGRDEKGGL